MNDGQKRRHIRNIAHLYLSGSRRGEPAPHFCLVIAGDNKSCFPGFHAANLAAALAARGCEVRVHDRSGLLPNAGFYLALPPSTYIRWDAPEGGAEPALAGVTFDCAIGEVDAIHGESPRAQVELFHEPPLSTAPAARRGLPSWGDGSRPLVIALIVGGEGVRPRVPARFPGQPGPDTVLLLRTEEDEVPARDSDQLPGETQGQMDQGNGSPHAAERPVTEIGSVTGWEAALSDRVPAVVRAPDSGFSAAYFAVADAIRFKVDELRRTIVGPASAEGSAGLRPGSADRRPDSEGAVLPISRFGARHSRRSSS